MKKDYSKMSTSRLNSLLNDAQGEDKTKIEEVLATRKQVQEAQKEQPIGKDPVDEDLTEEEQKAIEAAEQNDGLNPQYQGNKEGAKQNDGHKLTDEERDELEEKLKKEWVGHRCQMVPFGTTEWLGGVVVGIYSDKRANNVLLAIKTDDGKRRVKTHNSPLLKVLDEVVDITVHRGRTEGTAKESWTEDERAEQLESLFPIIGMTCSFPKTVKTVDEEGKPIDKIETVTGRIISLVPDNRTSKILVRIETDEVDEKGAKIVAHKVAGNEDLTINEEIGLDEIGQKMNDAFVARRKNLLNRQALTPKQKYDYAVADLEKAKTSLEKAQKLLETRQLACDKAMDDYNTSLNKEEAEATKEESDDNDLEA
jgi:hypothetical protein